MFNELERNFSVETSLGYPERKATGCVQSFVLCISSRTHDFCPSFVLHPFPKVERLESQTNCELYSGTLTVEFPIAGAAFVLTLF